jgi:hypothetical protein
MTPTGSQRAIPAVAALESSPTVAEQSIAAPVAHDEAEAPHKSNAGKYGAGLGVVGALGFVDQWLQQHGTTLADLTMKSGPLSGSLVANWPLVLLACVALWWAADKWREDRRERVTDRKWARQRAAAQDEHARRQVNAIRAVAEEIVQVRTELTARHDGLEHRVGAVEREVRDLRGRMPERRRAQPD